MLSEAVIEKFILKYIKDGDVVSIGTSKAGEVFLKQLALALELDHIPINSIRFVPTSNRLAVIARQLEIPVTTINDQEIDFAVEFVDQVDRDFNFVKRDSSSLVRDKMIAQSAENLVVVAEEKNFVRKIRGHIPFEIAFFGWKRTLNQLEAFGHARIREGKKNDDGSNSGRKLKTETGHYIVDVDCDKVFSLEDLEYKAKEVPGVLETGLFLGYADRIVLHNGRVRVLSRNA
ncbi:MAG: ribose-5-phosphate isomerase A [Candidatus Diapherotrites archaeon]|nr:ribose-5-phosphate isomerase A [Candidatus Diapherotrites archaeon]